LKKKQWILGLAALAALAALLVYAQNKHPFDFHAFAEQLRLADWRKIAVAVACIYIGYAFRAARWALLIKPHKKVSPFSLMGTQVIGFTAVALIGRVADPVRPYLVSKKTGLPLSSQVAVYIVERLFDAGSMALIFSTVILLAPQGALPHAEIVKKAGYWGLILTLAGGLFLVAVRMAGGLVASFLEATFGLVSAKLGHAVGHKIRTFRAGLDTMRTLGDFGLVSLLSLVMWGLITLAYLETTQAFVASPQLATMTLPKCTLLLAFSGVASVFQLPVLGWFTQIGLVAAAIASFYGAAPEASTACAATLLLVSFLAIVPVGLIWAQFEHVSLRKLTAESGQAKDEMAEEKTESPEWDG